MLTPFQLSNHGLATLILIVVTLASSFCYFFGFHRRRDVAGKNVPPGSFGFPVIGESWSFVKALRENKGSEWIQRRVAKHGRVFKTSLMGSPTVVITGQAGNKFVFGCGSEFLSMKQPPSIARVTGKQNFVELTGMRYKRMKGALMSFLRPENLQDYIGHMDALVKHLLLGATKGKNTILAVPFMRKLTFKVTCSLLFGLHHESTNEALFEDFSKAFKGLWAFPLNLPGTTYHQALQGRSRIVECMLPVLQRRKEQITEGIVSPKDDIISSLLTSRDENNEPFGDEAVIDTFIALLIASHDTTAILLSLMVWKLARDPKIYDKVLEEQMGIIREREDETQGKLSWSEVQKMRYTWRVAQELMRMIPPVFGNFRKTLKDISFEGYDIPQGWQVFWEASGTHMNKDIFEDPTNFDPSRFDNPSKPIPPFAYIPFGAGHRKCIGNEFARIEALGIMHHLVTNFEWSQLIPEESITCQPMPYPSKGLPIKLKPRTFRTV
ncbi:taxadiene 5-alpha hydroxylase-like [Phoenix dactylifera]|uniref:Taxadiene 5-alpha hydroxylase-like n=1 Tax=Phoenix dactylifera TaxID=42345 RepID=A0A8B7BZF1_PHODC|nr:taxadiene 5-alpha hydroxylase-like [Phoenix dactylifera]